MCSAGASVHGLRPPEIDAILALAREGGEIDASHRKLAHRGSYLGRVWGSPSTVLGVLLAYGQALAFRPARAVGQAAVAGLGGLQAAAGLGL